MNENDKRNLTTFEVILSELKGLDSRVEDIFYNDSGGFSLTFTDGSESTYFTFQDLLNDNFPYL